MCRRMIVRLHIRKTSFLSDFNFAILQAFYNRQRFHMNALFAQFISPGSGAES